MSDGSKPRRLGRALADSGPVVVLAGIAAAGSFTHIRDTASEHGQHGWMAWAIAVCIDLTCVMAARERHRDQVTGRETRGISWPTLVLIGGILLSLAANLAQAERSTWGWVVAGTPAVAFLVAVSMLERRASVRAARKPAPEPDPVVLPEVVLEPEPANPVRVEIPEPVQAAEVFVPVPGPLLARVPEAVLTDARDCFSEVLSSGGVPSKRSIRREMRVGWPNAVAIHDALKETVS